jgi:8-oxo-dGTP diphosphatase
MKLIINVVARRREGTMQANTLISENDIRDQAKKDGITHISTGVAILRDGKILMARRAAGDFLGGVYELPGGGVDEGETITEGAVREVKEETGLTVSKVVATFEGFDYSTDRKPHVRQVNFLVEVEPGEITLDAAEHDDYLWVDATTVDDIKMSEAMHKCVKDALAAAQQAA